MCSLFCSRDAVIDPWIQKLMNKLKHLYPESEGRPKPRPVHQPRPVTTPDIENLSSFPLRRFSMTSSGIVSRMRSPTSNGHTPTHAPNHRPGAVMSPKSFGSYLLCDVCHLDREVCSYECLSGSVSSVLKGFLSVVYGGLYLIDVALQVTASSSSTSHKFGSVAVFYVRISPQRFGVSSVSGNLRFGCVPFSLLLLSRE